MEGRKGVREGEEAPKTIISFFDGLLYQDKYVLGHRILKAFICFTIYLWMILFFILFPKTFDVSLSLNVLI